MSNPNPNQRSRSEAVQSMILNHLHKKSGHKNFVRRKTVKASKREETDSSESDETQQKDKSD